MLFLPYEDSPGPSLYQLEPGLSRVSPDALRLLLGSGDGPIMEAQGLLDHIQSGRSPDVLIFVRRDDGRSFGCALIVNPFVHIHNSLHSVCARHLPVATPSLVACGVQDAMAEIFSEQLVCVGDGYNIIQPVNGLLLLTPAYYPHIEDSLLLNLVDVETLAVCSPLQHLVKQLRAGDYIEGLPTAYAAIPCANPS